MWPNSDCIVNVDTQQILERKHALLKWFQVCLASYPSKPTSLQTSSFKLSLKAWKVQKVSWEKSKVSKLCSPINNVRLKVPKWHFSHFLVSKDIRFVQMLLNSKWKIFGFRTFGFSYKSSIATGINSIMATKFKNTPAFYASSFQLQFLL